MTPSDNAENSFYTDDLDECSHLNHEQSPLLSSGQIHPLPSEEEEDEDHARQVSSWKKLPWWRKPSPYWLIFCIPCGSIGVSALLALRVAMYTTLACRVHRPEFITNDHSLHSFTFQTTHNLATISVAHLPILNAGSETAIDTVPVLLPKSPYTASSDYSQNGSDFEQKCASDPVVQAVVARLNAVFIIAMGILSCLTTGWWGSLSDRSGRRIVVFVSVFGLFATDVVHVITAWYVDVLPGGYWFPLVGYVIEGMCGGFPTEVAISHAYLADTTDPSTRSRYFSLAFGSMFAGVAVGPVIGGLLMRSTGTMLSVFYFASILHGVYALLILFVLPESLTRARARGARLRRRQDKGNQPPGGCTLGDLKSNTSRFLSPLVVLLPEQSLDANPLNRRRRDWSLSCIAIAYGLIMSITGSYSYKYQYAAAQFNWTPEVTSYYISFVSAVRAFFLAVILPLIIKNAKPTPIEPPCTLDEPPRGSIGLSPPRSADLLPGSAQTNASEQRLPASRSPAFDLALARASAGLEITAYAGGAVAGTGALFTLANAIDSFAAGFSPAVQALALDLYTNRRPQGRGEVGKLFGALSVVQALGSQIISPALYGFVYFNTVATFPQAIMVVSMCMSLLALVFLLFVRISSEPANDRVTRGHGNEERGQGMETPEILVAIEEQVVEGR